GRFALDPSADWYLFVGDDTGVPAIAALAAALPADARAMAILGVWDRNERQALASRAALEVEWFHREGPPRAACPLLIQRLALFAAPPGRGQAFIVGETSTVRTIRQGLIARGMPREAIYAEGYWRPAGSAATTTSSTPKTWLAGLCGGSCGRA